MTKVNDFYNEKIVKNIAFEKQIKLHDRKETNNQRVLNMICKSLEVYSKDESKEIIYDLEHPSRDEQPSKDCNARGCTYSN